MIIGMIVWMERSIKSFIRLGAHAHNQGPQSSHSSVSMSTDFAFLSLLLFVLTIEPLESQCIIHFFISL